MEWLWNAAIVIAGALWVASMIRGAGRALEQRLVRALDAAVVRALNSGSRMLSSAYPVFSQGAVFEANEKAVEATRRVRELRAALLDNPQFTAAVDRHQIPADVSTRMLEVCQWAILAEQRWFCHAVYMEANLDVIAGRATRSDAFAQADRSLDQAEILSITSVAHAHQRREAWKARLESPDGKGDDPTPPPYANPWSDWYGMRPDLL